jgi:hypothetical protein
MKTLSGLTKCSLVLVGAFCFSAGECELKHNVIFLPDYATADQIILPGTALSVNDAAKLKDILDHSSPDFFTIQAWKEGVEDGPPWGHLPFPKCLKAHADMKKGEEGYKTGISRGLSRTNASRWSRVVGLGCQSRCSTNPGGVTRHRAQASVDLVNAVKPILQKYQKE